MSNECMNYNGVTAHAFKNLRETAKNYGITLPNIDRGCVSGQGFDGYFIWNETEQTLKIDIKSKPWFLSYNMIDGMISDAVMNFANN
jgi:hypothetical protein